MSSLRVLLAGVRAWAGDRTFPRHGQQGQLRCKTQSFVFQIREGVSRWSREMGDLSPTSWGSLMWRHVHTT